MTISRSLVTFSPAARIHQRRKSQTMFFFSFYPKIDKPPWLVPLFSLDHVDGHLPTTAIFCQSSTSSKQWLLIVPVSSFWMAEMEELKTLHPKLDWRPSKNLINRPPPSLQDLPLCMAKTPWACDEPLANQICPNNFLYADGVEH